MEKANSLQEKYPLIIRVTGLAGILLIVGIFFIFPKVTSSMAFESIKPIDITDVITPITIQQLTESVPNRPSIIKPSEDEDIAEDLTLEELDFDVFESWNAPPPPAIKYDFIPYDTPPKPLSPIRPIYPEIAQEAEIEGTVIVHAFIDNKGRVKETKILKGVPNTGLDEAAVSAIRKTRFKPAKQREEVVAVWISIPINFRLN